MTRILSSLVLLLCACLTAGPAFASIPAPTGSRIGLAVKEPGQPQLQSGVHADAFMRNNFV